MDIQGLSDEAKKDLDCGPGGEIYLRQPKIIQISCTHDDLYALMDNGDIYVGEHSFETGTYQVRSWIKLPQIKIEEDQKNKPLFPPESF